MAVARLVILSSSEPDYRFQFVSGYLRHFDVAYFGHYLSVLRPNEFAIQYFAPICLSGVRDSIYRIVRLLRSSLVDLPLQAEMLTPAYATPISKLPDETLSLIFEFLALDYPEFPIVLAVTFDGLSWLPVTHVCKRWYEVARDNAQLWSSVDFSRPLWAREMLKRSKGVPLTLKYKDDVNSTHPDVTPSDVFSEVAPKSRIVRRVHISCPAEELQGFLQAMCGWDVPALEFLSIIGQPYRTSDVTSRKTFLNGYAPRLVSAILVGCSVDPSTQLFRNVRSFYLSFGDPIERFSRLDMLTLLSNLPLVDTVTFAMALRPLSDEERVTASTRKVAMPQLRYMCIISSPLHDDTASPTDVLYGLEFHAGPPSIDIKALCDVEDESIPTEEMCARLFQPVFQHYPPGYFTMLEANHGYTGESLNRYYGTCSFTLRMLPEDAWPDTLGDIVHAFATCMPRECLREVELEGIQIRPMAFESLFGGLDRLERISTHLDEALVNILSAVDETSEFKLPSLEIVEVLYNSAEVPEGEAKQEDEVSSLQERTTSRVRTVNDEERQLWKRFAVATQARGEKGRVKRVILSASVPEELFDIMKSCGPKKTNAEHGAST